MTKRKSILGLYKAHGLFRYYFMTQLETNIQERLLKAMVNTLFFQIECELKDKLYYHLIDGKYD